MTDEQRAELKRLAEKATHGPWHTGSGEHWGRDVRADGACSIAFCGGPSEMARRDARFIAAANPATVLDLLAENERLRAVLRSLAPTRHAGHDGAWETCPIDACATIREALK